MIHEVTGDILLTKCHAIAHGIAPNDHFDHGLALALREKWPMMAKDFRHYANQCHPKPGEIWAWGGFNIRVFNLMTQEGEHGHGTKPGKANLANVNHCLRRLQHEIEAGGINSLALPKLATGVGGLEWSEVFPLLKKYLGELKIPVFVYSHFQAGVQAQESGI